MRYLCGVSYDGSYYFGFQRQPKLPTVQKEIEDALKRIYSQDITIFSSSRTDTGVHALDQKFHYDTNILIPDEKIRYVIDSQLPEYVSIHSAKRVPDDFHARYNVKSKTYRYDILLSSEKQVFNSRYALVYKKKLNLDKIKDLENLFIGKKDYGALMAAGSDKENTVRNILDFSILSFEDKISIFVSADGFLYHMVRIIVGALLDYNEDKKTLKELESGLKNKNREIFRRTAPAHGLYLIKTLY